MKNLIIISFLLLVGLNGFGQVERVNNNYNIDSLNLDTIELYDSKRNVPYCDYSVQWFFRSPCMKNFTYRFSSKKLSYQDSLIFNETPYYFKYYSKKGNLEFEGVKEHAGHLIGDIKYYSKSGDIERIEHYNAYEYVIDGTTKMYINDAPGPEGVWKYFDENNNLIRTEEYTIKLNKLSSPIRVLITTTYNSNKKVTEIKEDILF